MTVVFVWHSEENNAAVPDVDLGGGAEEGGVGFTGGVRSMVDTKVLSTTGCFTISVKSDTPLFSDIC